MKRKAGEGKTRRTKQSKTDDIISEIHAALCEYGKRQRIERESFYSRNSPNQFLCTAQHQFDFNITECVRLSDTSLGIAGAPHANVKFKTLDLYSDTLTLIQETGIAESNIQRVVPLDDDNLLYCTRDFSRDTFSIFNTRTNRETHFLRTSLVDAQSLFVLNNKFIMYSNRRGLFFLSIDKKSLKPVHTVERETNSHPQTVCITDDGTLCYASGQNLYIKKPLNEYKLCTNLYANASLLLLNNNELVTAVKVFGGVTVQVWDLETGKSNHNHSIEIQSVLALEHIKIIPFSKESVVLGMSSLTLLVNVYTGEKIYSTDSQISSQALIDANYMFGLRRMEWLNRNTFFTSTDIQVMVWKVPFDMSASGRMLECTRRKQLCDIEILLA